MDPIVDDAGQRSLVGRFDTQHHDLLFDRPRRVDAHESPPIGSSLAPIDASRRRGGTAPNTGTGEML